MKLLKFVAILSFLVLNACGQEQKKDTVAKEVQNALRPNLVCPPVITYTKKEM